MSANPLRCPQCNKGLMEGRNWPWKVTFARILKVSIILWIWGYFMTFNPDYYECPECGRKKPMG